MSRLPFHSLSLLAATAAVALFLAAPSMAAEDAVTIPAPAIDAAPAGGIQTAVLAGGCFWRSVGFAGNRGLGSIVDGDGVDGGIAQSRGIPHI